MLERSTLRLVSRPRLISRRLLALRAQSSPVLCLNRPLYPFSAPDTKRSQTRSFGVTSRVYYAATPPVAHTSEPSALSIDEYHERADTYLDNLLARLEEIAEEDADWDVEYSAGVLNATVPDKGTYVLNKQPPNKQIWLSSPVSGPKRYDWVAAGDGLETHNEEAGDWVYLRTGETLSKLLMEELDVDMTEVLVD